VRYWWGGRDPPFRRRGGVWREGKPSGVGGVLLNRAHDAIAAGRVGGRPIIWLIWAVGLEGWCRGALDIARQPRRPEWYHQQMDKDRRSGDVGQEQGPV